MIFFIIVSLFLVVSTQYVDPVLALFIRRTLYSNSVWVRYTSDLPDALLLADAVITICAYAGYRIRVNRHIFDAVTKLCLLLAAAMPIAYGAKCLTKFVFGRVNTRIWLLQEQVAPSFHWFHGGGDFNGFPSGHMVVFSTLLVALWRFYPRWNSVYLLAGTALAVALIATNYHFLGDIVAGGYLGLIVEAAVYRFIQTNSGTLEPRP